MAITWGNTVSASGAACQLGIDFSVVATSGATSNLRCLVYLRCTAGWVGDNYNTLNVYGSHIQTKQNIPISLSAGSQMLLTTVDRNFTRKIGEPVTGAAGASLEGFQLGTPTVSKSWTLDPLPYSGPAAPSNVVAKYLNDSQASVTWKNNPTSAAPYTATHVNLWDERTKQTVRVANLSGTATSYTVSALKPNGCYQIGILASNSNGQVAGPTGWSQKIYTSPAAPTSVTAAKNMNSDVVIRWTSGAYFVKEYIVYDFPPQAESIQVSAAPAESAIPPENSVYYWDASSSGNGQGTSFVAYSDGTLLYKPESNNQSVPAWAATVAKRVAVPAPSDDSTPPPANRVYYWDASTSGNGSGTSYAIFADGAFLYKPREDSRSVVAWVSELVERTLVGSTTLTQRTHFNPNPGYPHKYAVAAVAPSDLSSELSQISNVVAVSAPPLPPTKLSPNGSPRDASPNIRFEWQYNSQDTTAQQTYQMQVREVGTTTWTQYSGTTLSYRDIPDFTNGKSYEWQVRTRGSHPTYSPWSEIAVFATSAKPTCNISQFEGVPQGARVRVFWTMFDIEGSPQSGYELALLDSTGKILSSRNGSGTTSNYRFPTVLENHTQYTVRVRVSDGVGLWSEYEYASFTTNFSPPGVPQAQAVWDDTLGRAYITVNAGEVLKYAWVGTPNDSSSTKKVGNTTVATNRFQNPEFEGPFLPAGAEFTTEWKVSGTRALRIGDDAQSSGYGLSPYGISPYGM